MTREHYFELLKELDGHILEMGETVAETIGQCIDALDERDIDLAQTIVEHDSLIDQKRYEIENQALLLIATQQPLAGDLRTIAAILTIATELERIGDYCEGIAKLTLRMAPEPIDVGATDVRAMAILTRRLLHDVLRAYEERDIELAGEVWAEDDAVDAMYSQVYRAMIEGMIEDRMTIRRRTFMLWAAHNVERMADRVTNIAERVAFVVTGDVATFRDRIRAQTVPG